MRCSTLDSYYLERSHSLEKGEMLIFDQAASSKYFQPLVFDATKYDRLRFAASWNLVVISWVFMLMWGQDALVHLTRPVICWILDIWDCQQLESVLSVVVIVRYELVARYENRKIVNCGSSSTNDVVLLSSCIRPNPGSDWHVSTVRIYNSYMFAERIRL